MLILENGRVNRRSLHHAALLLSTAMSFFGHRTTLRWNYFAAEPPIIRLMRVAPDARVDRGERRHPGRPCPNRPPELAEFAHKKSSQ